MTLVRADLGTPTKIRCPRCTFTGALQYPLLVIRETHVEVEPWVLITCRYCELVTKAKTA
jgi:hypothetical protein